VSLKDRPVKLRELLKKVDLDAYLVTSPKNRRYLSGFSGTDGTVLILPQTSYLLTDFRYTIQAREEAPHFEVRQYGRNLKELLRELTEEAGVKKLGFEADLVTYQQYQELRQALPQAELVPQGGLVEELRQVKEPEELESISRAIAIADQAYREVLSFIRPGRTELEVAAHLENSMRRLGALKPSFETIVASGPRAAMPHGVASAKPLEKGELVVMDYGCVFEGYCSDITRTVVLGSPGARQREIYELVLEAQLKAEAGLKAGLTGRQGDWLAREVINAAGQEENFGHSLGHGVGLAIHEEPRLSPQASGILEPGMVVTVEPGVYLENWGGVRIEDVVVITSEGCQVLTRAPKELTALT